MLSRLHCHHLVQTSAVVVIIIVVVVVIVRHHHSGRRRRDSLFMHLNRMYASAKARDAKIADQQGKTDEVLFRPWITTTMTTDADVRVFSGLAMRSTLPGRPLSLALSHAKAGKCSVSHTRVHPQDLVLRHRLPRSHHDRHAHELCC